MKKSQIPRIEYLRVKNYRALRDVELYKSGMPKIVVARKISQNMTPEKKTITKLQNFCRRNQDVLGLVF